MRRHSGETGKDGAVSEGACSLPALSAMARGRADHREWVAEQWCRTTLSLITRCSTSSPRVWAVLFDPLVVTYGDSASRTPSRVYAPPLREPFNIVVLSLFLVMVFPSMPRAAMCAT